MCARASCTSSTPILPNPNPDPNPNPNPNPNQGEPYLEYANSRFAGWPFATGMLTFFASGYCVQVVR